jgi:hypothetical protein
MKVIVLCILFTMIFAGADAAYGLGGGGHHGDGRHDFSQQEGSNRVIGGTEPTVSMPEPVAALLLGLGILGLAGLTRKLRSYR